MLLLRSTLFQILFYLSTFVLMVLFSPVFLLPRRWGWWVVPFWSWFNLALLRFIVGLKVEVRGRENIPEGGYIVASKHQSAWETFALIPEFPDPTYILKRELRWIPIFGWYTAKFRQIPINRGKRSAALAEMMIAAKEAISEDRQIMIFPEGTRRAVGAEPKYKFGIAHLYRDLDCPVLPIALNAGLYWPRASWVLYPGTVLVNILPPIQPGLAPDVFHATLVETIETATAELCEEARGEAPPSPLLADLRPAAAD
ncbi:1-acyl-sn-glycerol-3-phosphate acyltransferase [Roseibium polysiphoniae]|uniref:1-acyl-sn-glycerol-3-phosphate acyltransferase n=1 Tax=Roseibium polysiphoniae TaxID=2571221 RepID=A0A944GUN7_9HYPH|nr:lysophospholipid acyltransferase family protein [Roseibium polysiphoniae]MBS8261786.1 1-acyl-sn-glycerol-3-phosphate acyltransferase [Roseibium polysiphoniae]